MFALTLPMLVGGLGLGVDTGFWYYRRMELQAAADTASYSGALVKRSGGADSAIRSAALSAAQTNGFDSSQGTITVNTPPSSGGYQNNRAVEVILSQTQPRFFTRLFSDAPVTARARAVSAFQSASNACVLALNRTASRAANFSGSSTTVFTGCSVMSNSNASDAVYVGGSGSLTTSCVVSAGGVSATSGLTLTQCTGVTANAPSVADPFADIAAPTASGGCRPTAGATLQPGRYCSGLSLTGTVTLNPGVYFISGGDFRVNANAVVNGTGVTIYLSGNARVTMNGTATVNLTAPTTGTYAGMLFFMDRNSSGGSNRFNGTAQSRMTGTIYAANQSIDYLGNFSGQNGCVRVVGSTVQWSGNTSVSTNCSQYGMRDIPIMQLISVVE